MADSFRRYTDLAAAIQLAKASGMTNAQIVRALTGAMTYPDAMKLAKRAAPLLDLTTTQFMRLRRNESRSSLFEFRDKALAVAFLQQPGAIQLPAFARGVLFDRAEQLI